MFIVVIIIACIGTNLQNHHVTCIISWMQELVSAWFSEITEHALSFLVEETLADEFVLIVEIFALRPWKLMLHFAEKYRLNAYMKEDQNWVCFLKIMDNLMKIM